MCAAVCSALRTRQSAEIAKEEAEYDNIYIVDSRSATLGLQLLVRRAVQRVAEGFSAMDIVADLETARTHLRLYAVVDTLKYPTRADALPAQLPSPAACWASPVLSGRPRQAGHGGQSPWHARRICRHF
ncbi:MAG: DegV family protein [Ruthenibacterium lactatiformans]